MKKLLILLILFVILVSGCIDSRGIVGQTFGPEVQDVIDSCIRACKQRRSTGVDLSKGPCLANQVDGDWVCDVAHSPRQDVDNKPENQCSAWIEAQQRGETKHFVEVTPDCIFIRAV